MYTLYGEEAKNGDYVLIQDLAYMSSSAEIVIAKVHNNKAYAARGVRCKGGYRWIRKETAICKLINEVPNSAEAELIKRNIEAEKTTFNIGTEEFCEFWDLMREAVLQRQEARK